MLLSAITGTQHLFTLKVSEHFPLHVNILKHKPGPIVLMLNMQTVLFTLVQNLTVGVGSKSMSGLHYQGQYRYP